MIRDLSTRPKNSQTYCILIHSAHHRKRQPVRVRLISITVPPPTSDIQIIPANFPRPTIRVDPRNLSVSRRSSFRFFHLNGLLRL